MSVIQRHEKPVGVATQCPGQDSRSEWAADGPVGDGRTADLPRPRPLGGAEGRSPLGAGPASQTDAHRPGRGQGPEQQLWTRRTHGGAVGTAGHFLARLPHALLDGSLGFGDVQCRFLLPSNAAHVGHSGLRDTRARPGNAKGQDQDTGGHLSPPDAWSPLSPPRDAGSPLSPPGRWEPPSPPPGPCAVSGSPFGACVGLLGRGAVMAPSLGARSRARVPPSTVAGPCARVSASFAGVRGGLRAGDRALPGGPAPFTVCPCVLSSRESNWPAARPACPNEPISPSRRLCARRSFAAAANYGPQITRRPRPLCTHSGRRGFVPMVPSKVQRGFS